MALPQIFRYPFIHEDVVIDQPQAYQVAQILYHNQRVICVDYDIPTNSPVVIENDQTFRLESPDLPEGFTMRDVFKALGYENEVIELTYPEGRNLENYLDTLVRDAPLSQLIFYAPNAAPNAVPNAVPNQPPVQNYQINDELDGQEILIPNNELEVALAQALAAFFQQPLQYQEHLH
jgi:hypothetical protein